LYIDVKSDDIVFKCLKDSNVVCIASSEETPEEKRLIEDIRSNSDNEY